MSNTTVNKPLTLRQKLITLNVSVLLALVTLEIALRIYAPIPTGTASTKVNKAQFYGSALAPDTREFLFNPDTGERIYYHTNSQGWKDVEHTFEKPPSIVRILFVGDSNTWGIVRLEAQYTRQVERLLKERGLTKVKVISIGVGGWGPDQELEALRLEGIYYEPDFVIYQFDINDVTDPLYVPEFSQVGEPPFRYEVDADTLTLRRIDLPSESVEVVETSFREQIVRSSAILYYLTELGQSIGAYFYRPADRIFDPNESARFAFPEGHPLIWNLDPEAMSPEYKYGWRLLEALIVEFQKVSIQNNAEFLLFSQDGTVDMLDFSARIDNTLLHDENGYYRLENGDKRYLRPEFILELLGEITNRHDIPFIRPTRSYPSYQYDAHPNEEGNLNMALDIVDFLTTWQPFLDRVEESRRGEAK